MRLPTGTVFYIAYYNGATKNRFMVITQTKCETSLSFVYQQKTILFMNAENMQNKNILLNLILSVKNHSKLYTNLAYSDADDVEEWTAVAEECGMSIAEAQHQWNILTKAYMEYLKNNKDFSLAVHMDFLQPHFFAINEEENIDEIELLHAIGSENFEETNLPYRPIKAEDTKLRICSEMQEQTQIGKVQTIKTQNPPLTQENSITNMSSLELIFLGYAKQLQKMPLALQLSTKRKIADIMDEAELQMMNL